MPGTRQPEYANDFNKADLLQLLLALQGKVNRELHVAVLGLIESKINDYTFRITAFPKMKGREAAMINAICIRASDCETISTALSDNKKLLCVALMTDMDSQPNYSHINSKNAFNVIESESQLHSLNNAVIVYLGDPVDGESRLEDYQNHE